MLLMKKCLPEAFKGTTMTDTCTFRKVTIYSCCSNNDKNTNLFKYLSINLQQLTFIYN